MLNLYIFNETLTNGSSYFAVNILSFLSVLCAICVIISKNPIVSVLFLIGLFVSVAGYLMMLGLNFIGLSYLLVYVGAVSILFLFILMLINVRISELSTDSNNSVPLGLAIGVIFNITNFNLIPYNIRINSRPDMDNTDFNVDALSKYIKVYDDKDVFFVSTHIWDGSLTEMSHITSIGNILYTSYPLWLIITSLILLLAMVGSIIITIKSK